jgi:hypothetical protein
LPPRHLLLTTVKTISALVVRDCGNISAHLRKRPASPRRTAQRRAQRLAHRLARIVSCQPCAPSNSQGVSYQRKIKMYSCLKTRRTLTRPSIARLIRSPAIVIGIVILLGSSALPQSDSERLGMSANELARRVVNNELKFQAEDHGHWMYRLQKEENGKKQSFKSSKQVVVLSAD